MSNKILIVQGGQYGSEAKGAITAYLCERDGVDYNVRTGATNAGHTVYYNGKPYAMQQLGVGWVNPDTQLVLGAGALIDPEILAREVKMVTEATGQDVRKRLWIDPRAGLHLPEHMQRSAMSGRHHAIGATGKGCSEALVDRIRGRGSDYRQFGEVYSSAGYNLVDTEKLLNHAWDQGATILLEGTQGQLLDLYLGPYPYTTHKQTGPAQWMLECGLSPALPVEITMVVRTFPIRVAGNSGPLPNETSWLILAGEINAKRKAKGLPGIVNEVSLEAWSAALDSVTREYGMPHGHTAHDQHQWTTSARKTFDRTLSEVNRAAWNTLPELVQADLKKLFEMTTVTKKLRRIARWNTTQFDEAIRQIRPSNIAVTFMNYLHPEYWYQVPKNSPLMGAQVGVPAQLFSYGPESKHIVDLR